MLHNKVLFYNYIKDILYIIIMRDIINTIGVSTIFIGFQLWLISSCGLPLFASFYVNKLGKTCGILCSSGSNKVYTILERRLIIPQTNFEKNVAQAGLFHLYCSYGPLCIPITIYYIFTSTANFVLYNYFDYKKQIIYDDYNE